MSGGICTSSNTSGCNDWGLAYYGAQTFNGLQASCSCSRAVAGCVRGSNGWTTGWHAAQARLDACPAAGRPAVAFCRLLGRVAAWLQACASGVATSQSWLAGWSARLLCLPACMHVSLVCSPDRPMVVAAADEPGLCQQWWPGLPSRQVCAPGRAANANATLWLQQGHYRCSGQWVSPCWS